MDASELTDVIFGFILAAIIMLTVLAWKDLMDFYILKYFPSTEEQAKWKWIYAGTMTGAFLLMTRYFQIQAIS